MDWKKNWDRWSSFPSLEKELDDELKELSGEDTQLEDSFYKYLEFGTGGMRGEMGPGTNRMNVYTIRRAAEGLARFIESRGEEAKARGVAIAYDSRHRSGLFAMETARTLGAHGIQAYIFEDLRPTPELSFAVRYLHAFAGVVVTASHNPPIYNGFKVYGKDGGQFPPEPAEELVDFVNSVENELEIVTEEQSTLEQNGLLKVIGEEIDLPYNQHLETILLDPETVKKDGGDLSIVFSPLHGTAHLPVTHIFKSTGFSDVHVVAEQAEPDPEFSTVKSPNPEEKAAFELAIEQGDKLGADLLVATDPDADRIGIAVKGKDNHYQVLSGNQTGALILDFLLSQRKEKGTLPENGIVMKTIVTSEMGRAIASHYGVETIDTLTGFKFIGEKIKQFEESGEYVFQFGYEESFGYLIADFVRDKDAVQSALIIAEMALWHKKNGRTIYEALQELYQKYGSYLEDLDSLTLKGKAGVEKIEEIMHHFRSNPPETISGQKVISMEDYHTGERTFLTDGRKEKIELPVSNVLKFKFEDNSWFCARPSGTEPKVKFYFGVVKDDVKEAEESLLQRKMDVMSIVHQMIQ